MSAETGHGYRPASPADSGRDSPVLRLTRQQLESGVNPKDKGFRRYAHGVDRALASYEIAQQEWADYISFLARLLKALQGRPPDIHIIPDSQGVATRLAQCLSPNLPPGVHRKTLDVYSYVFASLGRDNLGRDLHLYLPGLAPVLSFASLAVRPELLQLLRKYILPLSPQDLRGPLKSLILTVLPGLEEESSEDHEDWMQFLFEVRKAARQSMDKAADGVDNEALDSYFWQCLFLATITNPSRRQGALSVLVRELPKFGDVSSNGQGDEVADQLGAKAKAALSPEPGLLVRSLAAGLADEQALVQRGFLDLLVDHLPLNSTVLQDTVPQADLDRLVFAATEVVARRDMSLNRRLWAWLLGPDAKEEPEGTLALSPSIKSPTYEGTSGHAVYFEKYGLRPLTRSIQKMFASQSRNSAVRAKPFRLCLSLMDRWEVGGLLIPDILIPALINAYDFTKNTLKADADGVVKSASNFFDGVESGLIWAKFNQLASDAFDASGAISPEDQSFKVDLCSFIIQRFNIREEEMVTVHIPHSVLLLLVNVRVYITTTQSGKGEFSVRPDILDIADKLLSLVPTRAFAPNAKNGSKKRSSIANGTSQITVSSRISKFYAEHLGGLDGSSAPYNAVDLGPLVLHEAVGLLLDLYNHAPTSVSVEVVSKIVGALLLKVPGAANILQDAAFFESLVDILSAGDSQGWSIVSFRVIASVTAIVVTLQATSEEQVSPYIDQLHRVRVFLVEALWFHLDPQNPKHHVEAVRGLWSLEAAESSSKFLEAAISTILALELVQDDEDPDRSIDAVRRFSILWTHSTQDKASALEKGTKHSLKRGNSAMTILGQSIIPPDPTNVLARPLLLILDLLSEESTQVGAVITRWVQEMPSLSKVFQILTDGLRNLTCIQQTQQSLTDNGHSWHCLYYLRHLLAILKAASENVWITLAGEFAQPLEEKHDSESPTTIQILVAQLSMRAFNIKTIVEADSKHIVDIHRAALELILTIIRGPFSQPVKDLELEATLLERLHSTVSTADALLQPILLETITAVLKLQQPPAIPMSPRHGRQASIDTMASGVKISGPKEAQKDAYNFSSTQPPPLLIDCIKAGFQSPKSRIVIDNWVIFLSEILPLYADAISQNLVPLVECLCKEISTVFGQLRGIFQNQTTGERTLPEPTLIGLLNGLEHVLAGAHEKLTSEERRVQNPKSPEQPQGFFGNMVQGVFTGDDKSTRGSVTNNRLTIVLCFQDAVRTCFSIWSWGSDNEKQDSSSLGSYGYTALRMRNRARRLLEHLFAAEALECLETLATLWSHPKTDTQAQSVLGLLNVLSGSKPKHTIPAIFNAIYSRTNPGAMDASKQSSLTSELSDVDLAAFLVDYLRTVDDDAMDEIWNDCVAFLKDVLANPLPNSQILPTLLIFLALLAEKVEDTNFGEQRRMRKDLGDMFARLLAATFTTRPMGFLQEPAPSSRSKGQIESRPRNSDVLSALIVVIPQLKVALVENDRIQNTINSITANVTGPTLRARAFPSNLDQKFLSVLQQLTKIPQAGRLWKKDVSDALNDSRFFSMQIDIAKNGWIPILNVFGQNDKEKVLEQLAKIAAPTTAGIVFGVGATSARNEADRRTQLILRRIALLVLSSAPDTFAEVIPNIQEKAAELLTATATSSPSSSTRSDIFVLFRALALRIDPIHLAPLWPIIIAEITSALSSVLPDHPDAEKYTNLSVLQAAKLLDTLVALNLDDFQLHAWLFITDSIDAVYRPTQTIQDLTPARSVDPTPPLVDTLALSLANLPGAADFDSPLVDASEGARKPLLDQYLRAAGIDTADVRALQRTDMAIRVLRPWLGQLSLVAFEATYGLVQVDVEACTDDLVRDLFEEGVDA